MYDINKVEHLSPGIHQKKKRAPNPNPKKLDSPHKGSVEKSESQRDPLNRKDSVELSPEAIEALMSLRRSKDFI